MVVLFLQSPILFLADHFRSIAHTNGSPCDVRGATSNSIWFARTCRSTESRNAETENQRRTEQSDFWHSPALIQGSLPLSAVSLFRPRFSRTTDKRLFFYFPKNRTVSGAETAAESEGSHSDWHPPGLCLLFLPLPFSLSLLPLSLALSSSLYISPLCLPLLSSFLTPSLLLSPSMPCRTESTTLLWERTSSPNKHDRGNIQRGGAQAMIPSSDGLSL